MPIIMASAVIKTGRKRVAPPQVRRRANQGSLQPLVFGEGTTRMLLAVATPMHMMEPISAGNAQSSVGEEQEQHDPGQRGGKRRR